MGRTRLGFCFGSANAKKTYPILVYFLGGGDFREQNGSKGTHEFLKNQDGSHDCVIKVPS